MMKCINRSCAWLIALLLIQGAGLANSPSAVGPQPTDPEVADFFFVLPKDGAWQGSVEVGHGQILNGELYRLAGFGINVSAAGTEEDYCRRSGGAVLEWKCTVNGAVSGVKVRARVDRESLIRFTANGQVVEVPWKDFPMKTEIALQDAAGEDWLIYRAGDPETGPKAAPAMKLPEIAVAPQPRNPVHVPKCDTTAGPAVTIALSEAPAGPVDIRRASLGDGTLYLQVYAPRGPLKGQARVDQRGKTLATVAVDDALWLATTPFWGSIPVEISWPGAAKPMQLEVPATLVETRGSELFVNGAPFLVKGMVVFQMNDREAARLHDMGVNTIRGPNALALAAKYGFMAIASSQRGMAKMVEVHKSPTDERFVKAMQSALKQMDPVVRRAARNYHTLLVQVGNEQVLGSDPWRKRLGKVRPFERLDVLLAHAYNLVRENDLMIPASFSNCAYGYRLPDFYPVYAHNTYLAADRGWPPLEHYMAWQGCDRRPFIMTEYGANAYQPQLYFRGGNNPFLEYLHAWNQPNRWQEILAAGTSGGAVFCLHDYAEDDAKASVKNESDRGFTDFGILTAKGTPKMAWWPLREMYRDFRLTVAAGKETREARLIALRNYPVHDAVLSLKGAAGWSYQVKLGQIQPEAQTLLDVKDLPAAFDWRITYTSHGGLPGSAAGSWPVEREKQAFYDQLKERATWPLLSKFIGAEVMTFEATPAPPTFRELEDEHRTVRVALRTPRGDVYLSAWSRIPVENGVYHENMELVTRFEGKAVLLDDVTGEPMAGTLQTERLAHGGMKIKGLRVPYVSERYTQRPKQRIQLPLIHIIPETKASAQ